jgi:peptide/nickel transport system permease protein
MPNVISPILVLGTLNVGTVILELSGLSFLGLGAIPPTADWGAMVSEGVQQFASWWIALFPGLAILTVVIAFNLLGDALRDSLDPRTAKVVKGGAL